MMKFSWYSKEIAKWSCMPSSMGGKSQFNKIALSSLASIDVSHVFTTTDETSQVFPNACILKSLQFNHIKLKN